MKDRIFQLMKQQEMTQKKFAEELCIAEGTLSSIYTGRTRPTAAIVSAIHERFPKVDISWLMFGEGEMFSKSSDPNQIMSNPDVAGSTNASQVQADLFSGMVQGMPSSAVVQEKVKYFDKPQRRITEIRVFYDDGTFETFSA